MMHLKEGMVATFGSKFHMAIKPPGDSLYVVSGGYSAYGVARNFEYVVRDKLPGNSSMAVDVDPVLVVRLAVKLRVDVKPLVRWEYDLGLCQLLLTTLRYVMGHIGPEGSQKRFTYSHEDILATGQIATRYHVPKKTTTELWEESAFRLRHAIATELIYSLEALASVYNRSLSEECTHRLTPLLTIRATVSGFNCLYCQISLIDDLIKAIGVVKGALCMFWRACMCACVLFDIVHMQIAALDVHLRVLFVHTSQPQASSRLAVDKQAALGRLLDQAQPQVGVRVFLSCAVCRP